MSTSQPQRCCLRWNNHQSNMLSAFDQLLQNDAFVDVTIAVEGRSLRAHKLVLSACSPYFQDLLAGHPHKQTTLILDDIPYCDMRNLLDFMYKGEVNVDKDRLSAFLEVAESLRIKGLTHLHKIHVLTPISQMCTSPAVAASNPLLRPGLVPFKYKRGRPRKETVSRVIAPANVITCTSAVYQSNSQPLNGKRKLNSQPRYTPAPYLVQVAPELVEVNFQRPLATSSSSATQKPNEIQQIQGPSIVSPMKGNKSSGSKSSSTKKTVQPVTEEPEANVWPSSQDTDREYTVSNEETRIPTENVAREKLQCNWITTTEGGENTASGISNASNAQSADSQYMIEPLFIKEEVDIPDEEDENYFEPWTENEITSGYAEDGQNLDPLRIIDEAHVSRETTSHAVNLRMVDRDSKFQIPLSEEVPRSISCPGQELSSNTATFDSANILKGFPQKLFSCDICYKVFKSRYGITNHVFSHIDGVPPPSHICKVCGIVLPNARKLKVHKQTVHKSTKEEDRPYQCEVCNKSFLSAANLGNHKRVHRRKTIF